MKLIVIMNFIQLNILKIKMSTCNQYKINNILYSCVYTKSSNQVCILHLKHFSSHTTFQDLSSHIWLVAALVDSAHVEPWLSAVPWGLALHSDRWQSSLGDERGKRWETESPWCHSIGPMLVTVEDLFTTPGTSQIFDKYWLNEFWMNTQLTQLSFYIMENCWW